VMAEELWTPDLSQGKALCTHTHTRSNTGSWNEAKVFIARNKIQV